METRSDIAVTPDSMHGVKKSRRRRSRRGGRKVQVRRLAAIKRALEELQAQKIASDTSVPISAASGQEPEVITIDDSDDETIPIPVPPPPIEILDTDTALKVYNHREIPEEVLVSFIRNFSNSNIPDTVPDEIANWCTFIFDNQ
ncbi:hypothetical protein ANTPLA_LOCUS1953 [Anthophora plagiata]